MPDSVILRRLWEELKPMPDRAAATFRITAATLLVVVVMLAFRNKFLDLGPLLVLILMQRNTMMTRLVSVFGIVAVALGCLVVYGVAAIAWNIAWLRILLWVVIFWIGYFLMSRYKALSGVIVILSCSSRTCAFTSMSILFRTTFSARWDGCGLPWG